jgi:RNA polymerase sigma-70 factor (ECF subfamily)
MSRPAHGSSRPHSVDPAALARLRAAIAVARDPLAGPAALERVAFHALPRPRTATGALAAGEPPATGDAVAATTTQVATAEPHAAPEGDQAEVMAIVHRAQGSDPNAFGELYDRYVDLVYRYIYYRVGTAALAEDLTSETFLRALRRISSYTWQGRDFGAWLVTIARNLIADHYKSGRYRLEVTTADLLDAGHDRTEAGPEGEVLDSITNAQLLEAVKHLNAEQQECIVLRFLQGLSVAETALAMGKNEGAIKALQYRAVRTLGRMLPADLLG